MTVKCPSCGAEFEDGVQFCDQCGDPLPQVEPQIATPEQTAPPLPEQQETLVPSPITPTLPAPSAKLIVTRGKQIGVEYPLNSGTNEIGRWDDDEGYMPHVDLESQDTESSVHRRHALVRFDGSQWWLEHLKEPPSNPTRIRGRGDRLEPGKPVLLQDGDEIVVGRVIFKFVTS
jgi:pSer/pThr/pTyr-binding forkhead associated (FHA) protein